jgi:hypothetical protein
MECSVEEEEEEQEDKEEEETIQWNLRKISLELLQARIILHDLLHLPALHQRERSTVAPCSSKLHSSNSADKQQYSGAVHTASHLQTSKRATSDGTAAETNLSSYRNQQ